MILTSLVHLGRVGLCSYTSPKTQPQHSRRLGDTMSGAAAYLCWIQAPTYVQRARNTVATPGGKGKLYSRVAWTVRRPRCGATQGSKRTCNDERVASDPTHRDTPIKRTAQNLYGTVQCLYRLLRELGTEDQIIS